MDTDSIVRKFETDDLVADVKKFTRKNKEFDFNFFNYPDLY